MQKTSFASDNYSPAHKNVMEYMAKINHGHAPSYGSDAITKRATELFKEQFGDFRAIAFVPTGTGANILALKSVLTRSYDAVITTGVSHIFEEETGALSAIVGSHLFTISHKNGKLSLNQLKKEVQFRKSLEFHSPLPRVVSIASPTEYGTVYTIEEVRAIADFCHTNDLYLHMDGCRLPNALAALQCSAKEYTSDSGVDVLSFGGAKNGLLNAEAVIIFNAPENDILRLQKQTLQLTSKTRYTSGQFVPYFDGDLWLHNATHSNQLASLLAQGLHEILGKDIFTQPVVTNQIFCMLPDKMRERLRAKGHSFYDWNSPDEVRFVISWDNNKKDIDQLLSLIKNS